MDPINTVIYAIGVAAMLFAVIKSIGQFRAGHTQLGVAWAVAAPFVGFAFLWIGMVILAVLGVALVLWLLMNMT